VTRHLSQQVPIRSRAARPDHPLMSSRGTSRPDRQVSAKTPTVSCMAGQAQAGPPPPRIFTVAWIRAVRVALLVFTNAGAGGGPIARRRAPARRPLWERGRAARGRLPSFQSRASRGSTGRPGWWLSRRGRTTRSRAGSATRGGSDRLRAERGALRPSPSEGRVRVRRLGRPAGSCASQGGIPTRRRRRVPSGTRGRREGRRRRPRG
jgi:hypothetical protein